MKGKLKRLALLFLIVYGFFFVLYIALYGSVASLKDSGNWGKTLQETGRSFVGDENADFLCTDSVNKTTRNGRCGGKQITPYRVDDDIWLPVDAKRTMYVFSAYYIKQRGKVFVIGAKQARTVNPVCQFWYSQEGKSEMLVKEGKSAVRLPREGPGKKYTATIFECPVDSSHTPSYISLSTQTCTTPLNLLHVKNASLPVIYKNKFTVCLPPLYFKYGRAYELVEWIELNRILGAEKFVIYNHSTAINVDKVIEYYSKRGLAEVVQWRLPMAVSKVPKSIEPTEIHYFGQSAALNDCLFRSKIDSEYMVNVDLDEFIIPHRDQLFNWTGIIENVGLKGNVFLFRSTFFRKEWDNYLNDFPEKQMVEKYKLITLQKFEHEGRIFPPRHRSKYIARTAKVDKLMIHEVPGITPTLVPVEIGLVHHYRNWFNQNDRNGQIRDETVKEKFEQNLIKRVESVWKSFENVKLDIPWGSS